MNKTTQSAVDVHFRISPCLALQVEHAANACRTTKRALWIAAMCEYLGVARGPSRVVSDSATASRTGRKTA
jgi:hypothetical protein